MFGLMLILLGIVLGAWTYPYFYLPEEKRPSFLRGPWGHFLHRLAGILAFALILGGVASYFV